jgi:NADH:ubiquinone oxidoreductase subunit 3 (subunit A)
MAVPDPEEELRAFQEKEKGRAVLKVFFLVLIIDAVVIALYLILAKALGWNETALLIPLIVISVVTGFYYQWQKRKIEQ